MTKLKGIAAVAGALFLLAGCAANSSRVADTEIAFGKFTLVKNGQHAELGPGLLDSNAHIEVRNIRSGDRYEGVIGQDGNFALKLPAGEYIVEAFAFDHRGEPIASATNFQFVVPDNLDSVYIGDVRLEATVESGIYGVVGTADRYLVANDCADGCAERLAAMGLNGDRSGVSLLTWDRRMASATR